MPVQNTSTMTPTTTHERTTKHRIRLQIGDGRGRPPAAIAQFLTVVERLNSRGVAPTLADLRELVPGPNWNGFASRITELHRAGLIAYVPGPRPPYRNAFVVCLYFDDFRIKRSADHQQRLAKFHELIRRAKRATTPTQAAK